MALRLGSSTPSKLYLGATEVTKAYLGASEVYSSGAAAWTPAALGAALALWLDADDAGTITLNGSTVSQWDDKSGNGFHLTQATAASQPVYTLNGLNGLPSLSFDGTNDFLSLPSGFLHNAPAFSLAMVMQGPAQSNDAVFGPNNTNSLGLELVYVSVVNWPTLLRINGVNRVTSGFWSTNNLPSLSTLTSEASATAGWMNGSTVFSTDGNAPLNFNGTYSLGLYSSAGFANMLMSEFVITSAAFSTADRQKLEGYLAWKWGLEANLPGDHPYKTTPPTV